MNKPFLPRTEPELLGWGNRFSARIQQVPDDLGITTAMAIQHAALNASWAEAYETANNRLTRSPVNIELKNAAKNAMVASARELVRMIQAYPPVTDAVRLELGITVRDADPQPSPPVTSSPLVDVLGTTGWTMVVRLGDRANPTSRGRPAMTSGASVLTFVGETAPADLAQWCFMGNFRKTQVAVEFPTTVAPGAKVWVTAFWYNKRSEGGPAAAPQSTNLPGGGVQKAAV